MLLIAAGVVAFLWWILKATIPGGPGTVAGEEAAAGNGGQGLQGVGSDVVNAIREAARNAGINPDIAAGVGNIETGGTFNNALVSPKGAIGIMQLMPGTAAGMGVDPTNVSQNITGGVDYLASLVTRYGGDYEAALAAYNWGPGRVDKAIAQYGPDWDSHIPAVTSDYVDNVLNTF